MCHLMARALKSECQGLGETTIEGDEAHSQHRGSTSFDHSVGL